VWDKLHAHAEATVGERVRVITGLGMTETAPSCTFAVGTDVASGYIGLPVPGRGGQAGARRAASGKTEIRFRGPNVMPGYWRAAGADGGGLRRGGLLPHRRCRGLRGCDPAAPQRGLLFDGRTAEDFKLSTGTFVSVGPLRAKAVAGHPCVQDAVIAGLNRDEIGAMMVFPRLVDCAALAGLPADAAAHEVLHHPQVRSFFQTLCRPPVPPKATGSANRVARMHVLAEPPSIDQGEVTDKNSINQRAVLTHRAPLVEAMYQGPAADPWLILPAKG
jgi:feruloyl-CoA synthase